MQYIIEHLEPMSEWLGLEYRHCAEIASVLFTNVTNKSEQETIGDFAKWTEKSCLKHLGANEAIVLDPKAEQLLEPADFKKHTAIVIGGILGDAVPRGRTYEKITNKLNSVPRSLGPYQLSIDGATFLAKRIEEGHTLMDLEVANQPKIQISENEETTLHYAIPVFDGKPIITPGLLDYLKGENEPPTDSTGTEE